MTRRPTRTNSSDDYAAALSAMTADAPTEPPALPPTDAAPPQDPQDLPSEALSAVPEEGRRALSGTHRNHGALGVARTSIPLCLVLGVLLPLLGVGWFLAEPASPLRIAGPWLAWVLIGFGLVCAGSALLLMRYVARQIA